MEVFGSYEVIQRVAEGSTATVFKARHREIDRVAAIKDLRAELRTSAEFAARFRDEALVLAGFDDPHIVQIYDFVEEPARSWIAEEWIDGLTIAALLAQSGPMTGEQSLGVLRGALLGLAYAHDRGVVHGDVAPANIMADAFGTSKLIDFGLSSPSGSTGLRGTPAFMSPEGVRRDTVTKASDVYSAGAILYLLLAGRHPFPAPTVEAMLAKHVEAAPPVLDGHGPLLSALVRDAMAKDPARRPPDARAFLDRLEEAARERYGTGWLGRASIAGLVAAATGTTATAVTTAGGAGGAAAVAAAVSPVAVSTGRRFRKAIIGGGVAAVVLIALGVALAVSGSGENKKPVADRRATSVAPAGNTRTTSQASTAPPSSATASPITFSLGARYKLADVILASTYPILKPGPEPVATWTFALRCSGERCAGHITSGSGVVFTANFDGTTLRVTGITRASGPCFYATGANRGKPIPGSLTRYTQNLAWAFRVTKGAPGPDPAGGTPLVLAGPGTASSLYTPVQGACFGELRHPQATRKATLTLVRA